MPSHEERLVKVETKVEYIKEDVDDNTKKISYMSKTYIGATVAIAIGSILAIVGYLLNKII